MGHKPSDHSYSQVFGKALRQYRNMNGYTLRDIEEGSGVHSSLIHRFETGKAAITLDNALKICNYLGDGFMDLLKEKADNVYRTLAENLMPSANQETIKEMLKALQKLIESEAPADVRTIDRFLREMGLYADE